MIKKLIFLALAAWILPVEANAQNLYPEFFFTVNGNLFVPDNSGRSMYPILWHNKDAVPKMQVGGMGIGACVFFPVTEKFSWKGQVNISRHAFWEKAIQFTTGTAIPAGTLAMRTAEYDLGVMASANYSLTRHIAAGAGLGTQTFLISNTYETEGFVLENKYYRPIVPVALAEVSYRQKKFLFTVRYEQGLINRIKGDLGKLKNQQWQTLSFEIGYSLGVY